MRLLVGVVVVMAQLVVVVVLVVVTVLLAVLRASPMPFEMLEVVGVDVVVVPLVAVDTFTSSLPPGVLLRCLLVGVRLEVGVAHLVGVDATSVASPFGRASLVELLASAEALTFAGVADLESWPLTGVIGESMGTRVAVGGFEGVSLVGVAG